MGGLSYLKNINAPYNHLGIRYIPLGGVTVDNLEDYAKYDPVAAVGGSWLAPKDLIKSQDWKEITRRAKEAKDIWRSVRQ
jgi:2-dehydro-3-deoxyphosphogluconate aldolase/(4S)-4-hydroxy-2-oxoglutarate aldolase